MDERRRRDRSTPRCSADSRMEPLAWPSPRRRGHTTHVPPLRLALACAALLALVGCAKPDPPQPAPPQVGVITAAPRTVPLTRDCVGRLSAFRTADIYARVAGVLLKRTYTEGTEVKPGQLLFQIDPAPFRAALDNALAQLAEANATYVNARDNADRLRKLASKGYVSETARDNAIASERTAGAAAQVAQANVETARINLGYASVTSPIAGRAGEQQVTEGALVSQGTPTLLTTVDQIDPLYVNFTISVAELDALRHAQRAGGVDLVGPGTATVKVTLPDGAPYPHTGTLDFSSINVNPATGAVNLRALLPNPDHALLPGSFVTLAVTLGERRHAFLVPQPAVQQDTQGDFVYVVGSNGKVARKTIHTDGTDGTAWVVTSGLGAGDRIIVSGIQEVQPGATAKAVPWRSPSRTASTHPSSASAPGI